MKYYTILVLLLLSCSGLADNKELMCFELTDNNLLTVENLVQYPLENQVVEAAEKGLILIKQSNPEVQIPYQIQKGKTPTIWFTHNSNGEKTTQYCLVKKPVKKETPAISHSKSDGNLDFKAGEQGLISYRYEMKYPPEGIDERYKKSGYIHPVLSPKGDTLTRIQAPDHYHHYGIWGPWTRTRIEEVGVDFWNLKDGQGTVLFKEFDIIESGDVYGGFVAKQEHFNLTQKDKRQLAINENLKVKVWKNNNPNQYFIDYTSNFSSPLENGILFEAYRYGGGLGFRFKEQWDKNNCEVLTSEGKDRVAADGTSAKWCIVSGVSSDGKGTSGVLFMSHPENRSHPEPMRVWPLDANNGRGDIFFEFCPIRHKEWKIDPNTPYELNYRMLVFDGTLSPEEAEQHWKAFASQPTITISK